MKKRVNVRQIWRMENVRERIQRRMERNVDTTIAVFLRVMLDYETIKVFVNNVWWAISTQYRTIRVERMDDVEVSETFTKEVYERYADTLGDLIALTLETFNPQSGTFRVCVALHREHTLSGTEPPMIDGLDPRVVTVGRLRPGDYACRRWICVRHPAGEALSDDESLFGAALAFTNALGVHEVEASVRRAPMWEMDDTITSRSRSRCMLQPAPKMATATMMAKMIATSRGAKRAARGQWPYSVRGGYVRNKSTVAVRNRPTIEVGS